MNEKLDKMELFKLDGENAKIDQTFDSTLLISKAKTMK